MNMQNYQATHFAWTCENGVATITLNLSLIHI